MNEEAIARLIEANPKLKSARVKLESMVPGASCIHRSWGFGEITAYDEAADRLIIDFEEDKKGHAMAPAFCVDKLEILAPGHLLAEQKKDPDGVALMIKKEPVEIIVGILKVIPGQQGPAREIERILGLVIGPIKYKKWWTATKKLLVKDPRIAVPGRPSEPYVLRDVPVNPEEEILEEFFEMGKPMDKILLAERLITLSADVPEIKENLPAILETITKSVMAAKKLSHAEKLHGVWVRNDLARHLQDEGDDVDVETLEPTSRSIIEAADSLSKIAENIPSSFHKRLLDLLSRLYPEDWTKKVIKLLFESSGKFTSECVNFMIEREHREFLYTSLEDAINEQNLKSPVLLWILKNRNSKKHYELLEKLVTYKLLGSVFYAIDYEALNMTGNRRIALADYLGEDKEIIPEILAVTNKEVVHDLAQTLILNQGFEDLNKKSILARFIAKFPSVHSLIEGGADAEVKEDGLIVSQASFDLLRTELEELIKVKIPENKESISVAREHGDLKENSEFKMAKEDQAVLFGRRGQIEADLQRATVTDFSDVTNEEVGIGSIVDVTEVATGNKYTYSILGALDSDPDNNVVSYKTPLAQQLLAKKVGEKVDIVVQDSKNTWKLDKISRWIDKK